MQHPIDRMQTLASCSGMRCRAKPVLPTGLKGLYCADLRGQDAAIPVSNPLHLLVHLAFEPIGAFLVRASRIFAAHGF